ncbi:MAG: PaeR7I family type II restriction endonuclease [Kiritimatiellae bacterium]|nr:PaeR7I family type II restriction endonuclease [Kiritimatiellia bacterium]
MSFPYTDDELRKKVAKAASFYWRTRKRQAASQVERGITDAGTRGQVTGGRHLDGFANLIKELCIKAGFKKSEVFFGRAVPIPGYYRPQKNWDAVVLRNGRLIAAVELKSMSGSFGNNFNNRSEEVLGVSRDFWLAYRERAFGVIEAPWLGYFFFLEDAPLSNKTVALADSPLPPLSVFEGTGYLRRYEILCERLMLERDYTATALVVSDKTTSKVRDGGDSVGVVKFFHSLYAYLSSRSRT